MIIGLSVNHKEGLSCISNAYVNAVIKAGGTPVLIPINTNETQLDEALSAIDGLILSGGGDIHASFFNDELHPSVTDADEVRDRYDLALVRLAAQRQMPIFGICRGQQVLNVAFGGNIIQDIPSQHISDKKIIHSQSEPREVGMHEVSIGESSGLFRIVKKSKLMANSIHHQAVKDVAPGFRAVAFAPDGIIEGIESDEGYSIRGVQWHPENMAVADNPEMTPLFDHIVSEADLYKKAKEIHHKHIILDSHTDTPMYFRYGVNICKDNKVIRVNPAQLGDKSENEYVDYQLKVDVPKMQKGMLDAAVMVAYIPQGPLSAASLKRAADRTFSSLSTLAKQIENCEQAGQARTADDVIRLKQQGKKAILLGVENGYGIGGDIANLQRMADMGVVYITLSHNGDNDICDAAIRSKQTHNGLSAFGEEVIKEMNRLGIIVDISHTSEKTSFDAIKLSKYPVIASHSSVKALCNHSRNLSDDLIEAIAAKGGVVQICLYKGFLKTGGTPRVKDVVDHIDHVVKLVGVDYVGIGSDFDGGGGFAGLRDVTEIIQITLELLRRGYDEAAIAKIWGGNFLRVMQTVQNR